MTIKSILSGAAIVAALSASASAQSECIAYEPLRRVLIESGIRLEGSGLVVMPEITGAVEIWVSRNGEWAMLAISEAGIACIVLSGEGWTMPEAL